MLVAALGQFISPQQAAAMHRQQRIQTQTTTTIHTTPNYEQMRWLQARVNAVLGSVAFARTYRGELRMSSVAVRVERQCLGDGKRDGWAGRWVLGRWGWGRRLTARKTSATTNNKRKRKPTRHESANRPRNETAERQTNKTINQVIGSLVHSFVHSFVRW